MVAKWTMFGEKMSQGVPFKAIPKTVLFRNFDCFCIAMGNYSSLSLTYGWDGAEPSLWRQNEICIAKRRAAFASFLQVGDWPTEKNVEQIGRYKGSASLLQKYYSSVNIF